MTEELPAKISQNLRNAIHASIAREERSQKNRIVRTVVATSATLIYFLIIFELLHAHLLPAALMAATGALGFFLYNRPEPRIQVGGIWSSWIYSRLILAMVFLMGLEFLVCPHFALIDREHSLGFNIFQSFQHQFMSWGGIETCMFFCGFSFAGMAALLSFALVSKTLHGSGKFKVFRGICFAAISLIPVLGLQLSETHLRAYVGHWFLGGILGIAMAALSVKIIYSVILKVRDFFARNSRHKNSV